MFIQTEADAQPGDAEIPARPRRCWITARSTCRRARTAAQSPLAERLFDIPNVSGVFFGCGFHLRHQGRRRLAAAQARVLGAIMEHFMSGAPLVDGRRRRPRHADEFFDAKDAETVATDQGSDRDARAAGGRQRRRRHHLPGFKEGIVYLHMQGACSGCPSSTATLQARHPEPAAPLRAGRDRSPADVMRARRANAESPSRRHSDAGPFSTVDQLRLIGLACASSPSTRLSKPARPPCSIPSTACIARANRSRWRAGTRRR